MATHLGPFPHEMAHFAGAPLNLNRFTPNELAQIDRRTGGGTQGGPNKKAAPFGAAFEA